MYRFILLIFLMVTGVAYATFNESSLYEDIFRNYHKTFRPVPANDPDGPVTVDVSIKINNFGQFDTQKMLFELTLTLRQHWTDPRLNVKDYNKRLVVSNLKDQMWIPDLFFPSSVEGRIHTITNPNFLIWLEPGGNIIYSQKFTVKMSCSLDFWQYPMDDQMCQVDLSSYGYVSSELKLSWSAGMNHSKNVVFPGKSELNEFTIEKIVTGNDSDCGESPLGVFPCIQVKFFLKRNLEYYMIHNYFPSILIVLISWLSFLIDFMSAPARISLGLLSVLTLITQSALVIQNTPKISYIKAIDIWLFACLAFVISSLLEFAFINACCRDGPKPLVNASKKIAKISVSTVTKSMDALKGIRVQADRENNDESRSDGRPTPSFEKESEIENKGFLTKLQMERSTGYRIDGIFFVVYPLSFIVFNIGYWSYFYRHFEEI